MPLTFQAAAAFLQELSDFGLGDSRPCGKNLSVFDNGIV